MVSDLPKRKWCYVMPPRSFGMAPCACGNHETQWSEFEKHLWCEKCQKDFVPEHPGVLGGPVPVHTATMLGMNFDTVHLETGAVERFPVD